jgi:flavin-dependent dehydrogenase
MTRSCDVAIVGAGPTGLTLANLLGQAGISVVLVERNEGTVREPRAVSIDDEALRTMQAIGLIAPVLADVALDYGAHYFTPGGHCFLKVEPTSREYGFPRRSAFVQPKLEAALRAGLARFANVTTLFGHACESAAEEDDGVALALRSPDGDEVDPLAPRRLAVLPAGCNPDLLQTAVETGRDVDDVMASFVPRGREVILLVRPDRYVAAAALAEPQAVAGMAASVRALLAASSARS